MPEEAGEVDGWGIAALVVLALVVIDALFVSYTSTETSALFGQTVVDCGSGLRVATGNTSYEVCDEHRGLALARLIVGGGIGSYLVTKSKWSALQ